MMMIVYVQCDYTACCSKDDAENHENLIKPLILHLQNFYRLKCGYD